jgi:hypothetical protein
MQSFSVGRAFGGVCLAACFALNCSGRAADAPPDLQHHGQGGGGNGTSSGAGSTGTIGGGGDNTGVIDNSTGSVGGLDLLGDAGCKKDTHQGERLPLDMYFLVDQSGSMNDGVSGGSKWAVVAGALNGFFGDPQNSATGAGIGYFPFNGQSSSSGGGGGAACKQGDPGCVCLGPFCFNPGAVIAQVGGSCNVPDYATPDVGIDLLSTNAPKLTASLAAHGPGGGTPTSPALQGAYQYADGWATAHPGRKTVVVLCTDGDPTGCTGNDVPTISSQVVAPQLAMSPSMMTFVIGVGSSLTSLNALAQAGGTGQAFVVDTSANVAQQFTDALNKIRGQAVPCDFKVPNDGTVDPNKVNVEYTPPNSGSPQTILNVPNGAADCQNNDGWYYNSDKTLLSVCPKTCNTLLQGGQVSVVLGCPTQIAIIQ